jgi:hypothetical protein
VGRDRSVVRPMFRRTAKPRYDAPLEDVGACSLCAVRCARRPRDHERLRLMLVGHESFCPKGDRHGEQWLPFEPG